MDKVVRESVNGSFMLFISTKGRKPHPLIEITINLAVEEARPLLYFSLETDRNELLNRLIEEIAGLGEGKVQKGMLSPEEFHHFRKGAEMIAQAPLFIQENTTIELSELEAIIVKAKVESGIEVVVVDYPALVKMDGVSDPDQRLQKVCQELSRLSKAHKVTIVGTILEPRSGRTEDKEKLISLADEVIDLRHHKAVV